MLYAPAVPTSARYSYVAPPARVTERAATERLVVQCHVQTEIDHYYQIQVSQSTDLRELINAQLDQYKGYSAGWDGSGSLGPSAESLTAARQFLAAFAGGLPLPVPMLSPSGEVGFYWDERGGYADISFDQGGSGSFFSRTEGGDEIYEEGLTSQRFTRDWLFAHLGEICAPQALAA